MKIIFTITARLDIERTIEYISKDLSNPPAAENLIEKILRRVKALSKFPEIGPTVRINDKPTNTRYIVIENYILLYVIKGKYIYVTHIVYAKSDYLKFLST